MIEKLKKIKNTIIVLGNKLVPKYLLYISDSENYSINEFVKKISLSVKEKEIILDAGAGKCPYRKYFLHANYQATDFENVFNASDDYEYDFICSLDNIPKENNLYDVILNTQVLEHVEYPQKVINEFYRILKPGGRIFLVVPQGWGIHGEPYHYYNFTKFGIQSLCNNAGLEVKYIKERGGYLWYLSKRIKDMPTYLYASMKSHSNIKVRYFMYFTYPIYLLTLPIFKLIIPIILFYLDFLDEKKDFTLGYKCEIVKPIGKIK